MRHALDSAGNAYIAGMTTSSEASFPVKAGPGLTFKGGTDAFVAKVRADGTSLDYAGYIGGSGNDGAFSIALDNTRNAYVTGYTASSETTFPVKTGPGLTFKGGTDAFIAKVSANGTALGYAGYIGGSGDEEGTGVAVDSTGSAYITGLTNSAETSFPVKTGPGLIFKGGTDAFVAKVKADGTALDYAGYIGGDGDDQGLGIAVDKNQSAYITGLTTSSEATFPVKVGPSLTFKGVMDAFVAKVKADGTALDYAGYLGGDGDDEGLGISLDSAGNVYVTGLTSSLEATFPVKDGPSLHFAGVIDAFIARVKADGAALDYAGYIGGVGDDQGFSVAVDYLGDAYATGSTTSSEASFPVKAGPGLTFKGGTDAFAVKVSPNPCSYFLSTTSQSFTAANGTSTVDVKASNGCTWMAASNATWISLHSVNSSTVSFTVAANNDGAPRNGTMTIAGQSFTVYQGISFLDVPSSYAFFTEIGKLSAHGVTGGCGGGNYCPENPVTREQMAAFLIRALGSLSPAPPPQQRFADVPPSSGFYAFIDEMAVRQITLGCGGGNYCPGSEVTREQMAAFLIRALGSFNPPTPVRQRFADVLPSSGFYAFIDEMAVRQITLGCGGGSYCPGASVTRGQMAAFLVRAFGW